VAEEEDNEIASIDEVVVDSSELVDEISDVDDGTAAEEEIMELLSEVERMGLEDSGSNLLLDRTTNDVVEEALVIVSKLCMPLLDNGEGLVVVKVNDDLKPELVVRLVAKELRLGEKDDAIETELRA
jgi:hypothetical protein